MVLSTPDVSLASVAKVGPPLSPSKRQQTSSHYNDLESSPSKRRISTVKVVLEDDERKLLFTESTNNRPAKPSEELFDLSMQDVEIVKPKVRSTRATKPKAQTKKSRAKVEPAKTRAALTRAAAGKDAGRMARLR